MTILNRRINQPEDKMHTINVQEEAKRVSDKFAQLIAKIAIEKP